MAQYPDPAASETSKVYKDFLVDCGCAMDGNNGFCSQILGTSYYRSAMEALKRVLEESNCHTLDRYDLRAQRDDCGIREKSDLDLAADFIFNVNHWPLIHNDKETNCIKDLFPDSLSN